VTYSILGYDRANGDLGVAVQSKFPGVRSLVPYGEAGIGVVATQAFGNPRHGTIGLQLLRCGATPHQAVDVLLHSDGHRTKRQFALLDSTATAPARPPPTAETISTTGTDGRVARMGMTALRSGTALPPNRSSARWSRRSRPIPHLLSPNG
jgi:hypothetical protein